MRNLYAPIILLTCLFSVQNSFSQTWNSVSGGTNGTVYATVIYNNELYAAGSFTTAGSTTVNRLAKWNGTSWAVVGSSGADNTIRALTVYGSSLVAGGDFSTINGVSANKIAIWNGTAWSPLALGMNDNVYALTVFMNDLRAAGAFTTAGGVSANRIARWNGTSWSAMGSGLNDSGFALTIYNNELIAGGRFTTAGGLTARKVARYNGFFWQALGSGIDTGSVYALAVYNGLMVGGNFSSIGGVTVNKIAVWNGSNWSLVGTGMNNTVYSLYSSATTGFLHAGGLFTNAGGVGANNIASWNGSAWSNMGTGMSGGSPTNVYSFADYCGALSAGGNFVMAGGVTVNNISFWGSVPAAPTPVSPPNGATSQPVTPLIDWSDIPNSCSYGLQVSPDPNFNTTVVNVSGLTVSQYQVPLGALLYNTTYFWRVNSRNSIGVSSYSIIFFFTTGPAGIHISSNEIPKEYKLEQNYPNPFNPETNFKFQISNYQFVSLKIFDILGKETAVLVNEQLKPGYYEVSFDASDLPSGVYFYKMTVGDFVGVKRMMLVK